MTDSCVSKEAEIPGIPYLDLKKQRERRVLRTVSIKKSRKVAQTSFPITNDKHALFEKYVLETIFSYYGTGEGAPLVEIPNSP